MSDAVIMSDEIRSLSDTELDIVSGGWTTLFLSGRQPKEAREDRKIERMHNATV